MSPRQGPIIITYPAFFAKERSLVYLFPLAKGGVGTSSHTGIVISDSNKRHINITNLQEQRQASQSTGVNLRLRLSNAWHADAHRAIFDDPRVGKHIGEDAFPDFSA